MIEEIFKSVRSYGSRSRNKEEWNMVFNHLYAALLCINSQEDMDSFKKHFYSYIRNSWFFKEHEISKTIQSILNQELYVFDKQAGIDSFKENHEDFSVKVRYITEKERREFDEQWKQICTHAKNGGMYHPLFYLD